tara:strand:- start:140 stop:562 length:423 start_codon:yes stop_codon:yes gene_type:complete
MRQFLKPYKDILVYHDYGPLLLFWNIADIANNRVIWMSYSEAIDQGQEWAYFQYSLYFVVAIGMLFSLPNVRSCARFVGAYLLLYVFSTTRFISKVLIEPDFASGEVTRSLVITGVYFTLWVWIYWKMRIEILHKDLQIG